MSEFKQKQVIKKMVENGCSVKEAMKDKYSPAYAHNSNKIVKTKSFQKLLDKYLPDKLLTKKHRELLESQKVISANVFPDGKDGKPVNDFIEVPDNITQGKMVELGYKVKKHLIDKVEHSGEIRTIRTEEELDAIISKFRTETKVSGSAVGKSSSKSK